jgi:hypothetical protein
LLQITPATAASSSGRPITLLTCSSRIEVVWLPRGRNVPGASLMLALLMTSAAADDYRGYREDRRRQFGNNYVYW